MAFKYLVLLVLLATASSWNPVRYSNNFACFQSKQSFDTRSRVYSLQLRRTALLRMSDEKSTSESVNSAEGSGATTTTPIIPIEVEDPFANETPEEKYKREKLAEIAELKAKEVFVTRNTGRYECQACGYIYDETKGLPKRGIIGGTPFKEIEKFRCPQCGASKKYFVAETEMISGFKENMNYGIGTNTLTSGQKSLLIYGGLILGFAVFMSGYLLE